MTGVVKEILGPLETELQQVLFKRGGGRDSWQEKGCHAGVFGVGIRHLKPRGPSLWFLFF
jgi:hypothetical protein